MLQHPEAVRLDRPVSLGQAGPESELDEAGFLRVEPLPASTAINSKGFVYDPLLTVELVIHSSFLPTQARRQHQHKKGTGRARWLFTDSDG